MLVTATSTPSSNAFQTCSSNSTPDRRASLAGHTVRDVRDPCGGGGRGGEVPRHQVLRPDWREPGRLPPPAPPLRHTLQARPAHQARHPMAATSLARIAQLFPESRTADDAIMLRMEVLNPPQQPGVLLRAGTRRSCHPAVIPAGRPPQAPAHQSDGKRLAAAVDHPVLHRDTLAKNTAASRKKSRSFVTRASSRLRCTTSSLCGRP